jgi:YgiT-type zinc finger domain-containing protein
MTCFACSSETVEKGRTSYVVERDDRLVVVRDAPALICRQCGEAYFDNDVALALYEQAEKLLDGGHDVEIAKYAA